MKDATSYLRIAPEDNVIIGAQAILRYIGLSSITTLYDWIEDFAFPAIKRPDNKWMTTMTAVDTWIFQINLLIAEKQRAVLADRRKDKERISELNRLRALARRAGRGVGLVPGRRTPKSPYTSSMTERIERAHSAQENADE